MENVVEYYEIRCGIIIIKAKVGAHPTRVILYRAITIELDIVGKRIKITVNHTIVRGIGAIELVCLRV